jgi:hypothetical protein
VHDRARFNCCNIKLGVVLAALAKIGDEAANKKLSLERAQAVQKMLQDAGVNPQVEGAEGYLW